MSMAADTSLRITEYIWNIAEGLQRITPIGKEHFDITAFNFTPRGFKITFTRELENDLAAKDLKFKSFTKKLIH